MLINLNPSMRPGAFTTYKKGSEDMYKAGRSLVGGY